MKSWETPDPSRGRRVGSDLVECGRGYMNIAGGKLIIRLVGSYTSHSVRPGGEMAKGEAQYK